MSNKFNLIYQIILTIAVAILFYLHSTTCTSSAGAGVNMSEGDSTKTSQSSSLYYVNTDSISINYEFAKELDETLKKKRTQSENTFKAEAEKFEKEVREFQEKARFMTQMEGEEKQEELVIKERKLAKLEKDLSEKLLKDQEELNIELRKNILDFIKQSRSGDNFSFVFGYSAIENNILVANDSLDITDEILKGLNAEYALKKKAQK